MQNKNLTHSGEIETVEQAAEKNAPEYAKINGIFAVVWYKIGFKEGAQWQKEQSQRPSLKDENDALYIRISELEKTIEQSQRAIGDIEEVTVQVVKMGTACSRHAENFDTKENAYLDGVRYGSYTALDIIGHQSSHTQVIEMLEKRIGELNDVINNKSSGIVHSAICVGIREELINILSEFKG